MSQTINQRNQKNAQSSTGPQTAAGKATSSRNSLKHGMYSKIALLESEDREEYLEFTTALKTDLKPVGSLQEEFAQIIADNFWRLRRFRAMEANQLERLRYNAAKRNGSEPGEDLALGWEDDCRDQRSVDLLGRHEQRLSNQTNKAYKQLKDLQREAREPAKQELDKPKETKAAAASGFVPQHSKTAASATPETPDATPAATAAATPVPPMPPNEIPSAIAEKRAA